MPFIKYGALVLGLAGAAYLGHYFTLVSIVDVHNTKTPVVKSGQLNLSLETQTPIPTSTSTSTPKAALAIKKNVSEPSTAQRNIAGEVSGPRIDGQMEAASAVARPDTIIRSSSNIQSHCFNAADQFLVTSDSGAVVTDEIINNAGANCFRSVPTQSVPAQSYGGRLQPSTNTYSSAIEQTGFIESERD